MAEQVLYRTDLRQYLSILWDKGSELGIYTIGKVLSAVREHSVLYSEITQLEPFDDWFKGYGNVARERKRSLETLPRLQSKRQGAIWR